VDDADPGQFVGEAAGGGKGVVGAGVVGDRDPPGEGESLGQPRVEGVQAPGQGALLVVDRHDDVHCRSTGFREKRAVDRLEWGRPLHAGGDFGEVGGGSHGFLRHEGTADCGSRALVQGRGLTVAAPPVGAGRGYRELTESQINGRKRSHDSL
jgi:hypothetical protein